MSIFISYRRKSAQNVAHNLYNYLSKNYATFLDAESIKNGYFDEIIKKNIKECLDFIIIVTEDLFDQCNETKDWVLYEIETALQENKNIIPIFVGVKCFPLNIPETITNIKRFNGIIWSNETKDFENLIDFLLSNKKYVLQVANINSQICIDNESQNELKKLYHRFEKESVNRDVDIKIAIKDIDDVSILSIRNDLITQYGFDEAKKIAKQFFVKNFDRIKNTIETAIEFMIKDEMLDSCAFLMSDYYLKKYGVQKCFFTDEIGIDYFYWVPFLWTDIINEILKELIFNRQNYYLNNASYIAIDCIAINKSRQEIWAFTSYLSEELDHIDPQIIKLLNTHTPCLDYYDIPIKSKSLIIYPDLYYKMAHYRINRPKDFNELLKIHGIFDINNYYFGLH